MNRFTMRINFFLCIALLCVPTAHASSPISFVGGASVSEGKSSVELRFGYTEAEDSSSNDQRFRMRQHFDYGVNDWYAIRILTAQDDRKNDNLEHQVLKIENRFQLIERRDHGWDGGIRLNYAHSDGDKTPHELEVSLLAQVPLDEKWEWRHNTIVERDIGEDSEPGITLEFRNQIMRKIDPPYDELKSFKVGVEMYNDFDKLNELSGYSDQAHQFGPTIKGSFHNGMFFQTGYRAGISRASADHIFSLAIGKKF